MFGHKNQSAANEILRNLMGEAKQRGWFPSSAQVTQASGKAPRPVGTVLSPEKEVGSKWTGQHRGSRLGLALREDLRAEQDALDGELEMLALEDKKQDEEKPPPSPGNDPKPQRDTSAKAKSKAALQLAKYVEPKGGKYALTAPTTIYKDGKAITISAGAITAKKYDMGFAMACAFLMACAVILAFVLHGNSFTDPLMANKGDSLKWTLHSSGTGELASNLLIMAFTAGVLVCAMAVALLRYSGAGPPHNMEYSPTKWP